MALVQAYATTYLEPLGDQGRLNAYNVRKNSQKPTVPGLLRCGRPPSWPVGGVFGLNQHVCLILGACNPSQPKSSTASVGRSFDP